MAIDKMQRQRFEMKYILGEEKAQQIREFVQCHLELDENGVGKPNLSYPVHSLYLDSDRFETYWMTVNSDKNRFKLRLRFYNSDPSTPVFFEIKRRVDNCIMKQRGGVKKDAVQMLMDGHLPDPAQLISSEGKQLVAIQNFCEIMQYMQATPKMHISYQREAWVDPNSDRIRVTFDRTVKGEYEPTTNFSTDFKDPVHAFGKQVILEIKFTNRFPDWARALVERFQLMRTGAAKYCESIELIEANCRESGLILPWHRNSMLHSIQT